jgi:DNA-binding NarL/FixJ family response regulator
MGDKQMYKIKVLLADDHDSFRRILFAFLKSQKGIEIVGEAADGKEVVEQAERLRPDVIFMDIHMPRQNGLEATKEIKNRWPSTKVFLLSMDSGEFYYKNAQEFSDGFITKSSMKKALLSVLSNEQQLRMEPVEENACAA